MFELNSKAMASSLAKISFAPMTVLHLFIKKCTEHSFTKSLFTTSSFLIFLVDVQNLEFLCNEQLVTKIKMS